MPSPAPHITLTDFDNCTIGTSLQLMKAMLPFIHPGQQKMFAILIRIMEFNMTLDYFSNNFFEAPSADNPEGILCELKRFCPQDNVQQLEMIINLMKIQRLQGLSQSPAGNGQPDISDLFTNIMAGSLNMAAGNCEANAEKAKAAGTQNNPSSFPQHLSPMDMLSGMLTPEQSKKMKEFEDLL